MLAPLQIFSQSVPSIPTVVWCWDASELFGPNVKLKTVKHLVASSGAIASRVGSSEMPLTVVHPGVYSDEVVACYDVEGQMPCLVSLDPLSNRAAYEALMRACRMLADEGQEFLLFAYDTGKEEYPIWQMAEKMKLLEHLSFVPFQQDAEPLLLHGDLYIHILPTTRVQYRSLEAMARGLAIVTCANHAADYLIDGQTCRDCGAADARVVAGCVAGDDAGSWEGGGVGAARAAICAGAAFDGADAGAVRVDMPAGGGDGDTAGCAVGGSGKLWICVDTGVA